MKRANWRTTYHEAGHSVVGIVLGLPFTSVAVFDNGEGEVRDCRFPNVFRKQSHANHLIALWAGPCAEAEAQRVCPHDHERPCERTRRFAMYSEPSRNDRERAHDFATQAGLRAEDYIDPALALVIEHWRAIEAVASALSTGDCSYSEVVALVRANAKAITS